MRQAAVVVAAGLVLCGCAADVGDTELTLHQRMVFADGTSYALSQFTTSERDSGRTHGGLKTAGPEVTVWVEITNAGQPLPARDVGLTFTYTGDDAREVQPRLLTGSSNVVPAGGRDRVSKTFLVRSVPEVFRARYLRIVVSAPGHPDVTFRGSNP